MREIEEMEEALTAGAKDPKPASRALLLLNMLLQTVLAIALFFIINYLSLRHYKSWDQSLNQDYSLSATSRELIANIKEPTEIISLFAGNSRNSRNIKTLCDQYLEASKASGKLNGSDSPNSLKGSTGKISYRHINTLRKPDELEQLRLNHNLSLKENAVLLLSEDQSRVIPESALFIKRSSSFAGKEEITIESRAEDILSSALLSLSEKKQKTIYLLADKSSLPAPLSPNQPDKKGRSSLNSLSEMAARQNSKIASLQIAATNSIPEDCAALLLIAPAYDLKEQEISLLENYIEEENGSLLILLNPRKSTPRLSQFLRSYGILPMDNRVLYAESSAKGPNKQLAVECLIEETGPFSFAAQTKPELFNARPLLPGQSQSLMVDDQNPSLKDRSVQVKGILQATERYWGERNFREALPVFDKSDQGTPVYLAACSELGAVEDLRLNVDSSRIVALGNWELLEPNQVTTANYDFMYGCLSWLLDREELIGIPSKLERQFRLQITDEQQRLLFQLLAIALPSCLLAIAFLVWSLRRN